MNKNMSISMPARMAAQIQEEVKEGNFSSASEFLRHLVRLWNTGRLDRIIKKADRNFDKGKYKVLKSLRDLR